MVFNNRIKKSTKKKVYKYAIYNIDCTLHQHTLVWILHFSQQNFIHNQRCAIKTLTGRSGIEFLQKRSV